MDSVRMRGQLELVNANARLTVLRSCRQKLKNGTVFGQGLSRNGQTGYRNQERDKQNAGNGHDASRFFDIIALDAVLGREKDRTCCPAR